METLWRLLARYEIPVFLFINKMDQPGTDAEKLLEELHRKCGEYGLMVDIHDEYRPTGFSRTYPNLMTQEGIGGNAEMPDALHNTILPYTRFLAGAAAYTLCYFNGRVKNTKAHQLAMAAVYYSPLQFMFWYDRPEFITGMFLLT